MNNPLFTDDFKTTPYWWEQAPPPGPIAQDLPAKADVVVIGAGYTGLSAALQTARGGRHTVVIDTEHAGYGCSSRNGGQISTSIKPSYDELSAKYGKDKAFAILREGHNALAWIEEFVKTEHIDCHFSVCGKFLGAHNPVQYEKLGKAINSQIEGLKTDAYLIPRSEQRSEIGSDYYHGGAVYPKYASLHPGLLHRGLYQRVLGADADIVTPCAALSIETSGDQFAVKTSKGTILTREVIVATNGYTGPATSWHRRRIIPIGSYIIATEPLGKELMNELVPNNRMLGDTRKVVFYYRSCPDRQRIIFGGRVSITETNAVTSGPKLRESMLEIFPQLATSRISHSWTGTVGYTFDTMAHLGRHDGIHYAMGYCGSGVSMAGYLGMHIGKQLLGHKDGGTGLDGLTFQTRPLYTGNPWFLAASVKYYRWLDSLNR